MEPCNAGEVRHYHPARRSDNRGDNRGKDKKKRRKNVDIRKSNLPLFIGLPKVEDANALWSLNRQTGITFIDRNGQPIGARGPYYGKGVTLKTGQCHVHRYLDRLYRHIVAGDLDPSFVITHQLGLDLAPDAYETFKHKQDDCVKVVLKP